MNREIVGTLLVLGLVGAGITGAALWLGTDRAEKSPPTMVMHTVGKPRQLLTLADTKERPDMVPVWVSDGERSFTFQTTVEILLGSVLDTEDLALSGGAAITRALAQKYSGVVVPTALTGSVWRGENNDDTVPNPRDNTWFAEVGKLFQHSPTTLRAVVLPVTEIPSNMKNRYLIRIGESDHVLLVDETATGGTTFENDIRVMMRRIVGGE